MRLHALTFLIAALLLPTGCARHAEPGRPGILTRSLRLVGLGREKSDAGVVRARNLTLAMTVAPDVVKLSEVRLLRVTLQVSNRSRRAVSLQFPTTQRIDVIVRDEQGKQVTQWSEDQAFENEPVFVTVNPGERIEYNASVATRDLEPGKRYVVEAFFPKFDELKVRRSVVPVP